MADYITQTQLANSLPAGFLQQALDDGASSGMTAEEVWAEIMSAVNDAIHGALAPKYVPPYPDNDPVLFAVRAAARVLARKTVFERRRVYDEALWEEAAEHLKNLRSIGQKRDLAPSTPSPPPKRSVRVISEPAKFSRQP